MIARALYQPARMLALSALILGLGACVSTEFILPPDNLLEDCPKAQINGETNLDLANAYNARGRNIDECNADKRALRTWRDELIAQR